MYNKNYKEICHYPDNFVIRTNVDEDNELFKFYTNLNNNIYSSVHTSLNDVNVQYSNIKSCKKINCDFFKLLYSILYENLTSNKVGISKQHIKVFYPPQYYSDFDVIDLNQLNFHTSWSFHLEQLIQTDDVYIFVIEENYIDDKTYPIIWDVQSNFFKLNGEFRFYNLKMQ